MPARLTAPSRVQQCSQVFLGRQLAAVWLATWQLFATVSSRLAGCAIVFAAVAMGSLTPVMGQEVDAGEAIENPFPNRLPAVELDGGVEWLNVGGPIELKDLRGKVVLLDFWTFCCINCIHVLPDLKYLEKKYPNELVVIGVHSAKFDNEKETGNIRQAIMRYEVEHPVVNDANMTVWRKFQVRSWPTLVLIDPEGYYCGYLSGEGNREVLDTVIPRLIAYHRAKGTLDETPVRFDLERSKAEKTALRYPGKILADAAGDRLFISDSNHNRIVVTTLDGKLKEVIGNGQIGAVDGDYQAAQFDHPQGMALVGETLYVADTENHLIRAVDLEAKQVTTLAGTGQQARGRDLGGLLRETALNSPWDLLVHGKTMYIAMAGPHQIWAHQLGTAILGRYAGSGREDIIDGPLDSAALAQPSGLATDGKFLYVVDSEGSSVRKISLYKEGAQKVAGSVQTVVGTSDLPGGRSLFEFGDTDGEGSRVRLQHPLGIAYHQGTLYVADSYNHKIKAVDIKALNSKTWLGDGQPGVALDPVRLAEPAGLSIANGMMYVADTNNHRVCVVDLATKGTRVLEIAGLEAPAEVVATDEPVAAQQILSPVSFPSVMAGQALSLDLKPLLPEGYQLNPLFPVSFKVKQTGGESVIVDELLGKRLMADVSAGTPRLQLTVATAAQGEGTYAVQVSFGYCSDGKSGLCKVATKTIPLTLIVGPTAAEATAVEVDVR